MQYLSAFLFFLSASSLVFAAPVSNLIDDDVYLENGREAQSLNTFYQSLKPTDACETGDAACVNGAIALCLNKKWDVSRGQCGRNEGCFAVPSIRESGVILACTTEAEAASLIENSGVTGGVFADNRNNTSTVSGTATVTSVSASTTVTITATAATATVTVLPSEITASVLTTTLSPEEATSILSRIAAEATATVSASSSTVSASSTSTSDSVSASSTSTSGSVSATASSTSSVITLSSTTTAAASSTSSTASASVTADPSATRFASSVIQLNSRPTATAAAAAAAAESPAAGGSYGGYY